MEFLNQADVKEIKFKIKIKIFRDKFVPKLRHITYPYYSI